jgi:YD repeat-containing protein
MTNSRTPQRGFLFLLLWLVFLGSFCFASTLEAQTVTYTYDTGTNGIGRLTSMSDSSGSTTFTYDSIGRVKRTDKVVDTTT